MHLVPAARVKGVGASPGIALGRPFVLRPATLAPPEARSLAPTEVGREQERLRSASAAAAAELESLAERLTAEGKESEAGIFRAQALMATDPSLLDAAALLVAERHIDALSATAEVAGELAAMLRGLDDELLAARAADVLDVAGRIGGHLNGGVPAAPVLRQRSVIVAADLAPSVTATLPRELLEGIVLEGGSPTAHAAILARGYGIPAVVAAPGAIAAAEAADTIALDGSTGDVLVDPDGGEREALLAMQRRHRERRAAATAAPVGPTLTPDGTRVLMLANIGSTADIRGALEAGAEGVGLMRTEFLFLERDRAPDVDEQERAYRAVLAAFAPRPVTIRLLDVGGDKEIPYLRLPREANPFLGVRALRLAQDHRDLFATQLRALARASEAGSLKVMAAMIADGEDIDTLHELWSESAGAARAQLGAMVEIPAAAVLAAELLQRLDFASLGTNDLLQYTVAADRGNAALARYQDPLHPALLRLIAMTVRAAEAAGKELSVCGEMAGDPVAAAVLVGLGIRQLSMTPAAIPEVRAVLRANPLARLRELAAAAERESGARTARERVMAGLAL
jgi:phosphoenolpyruvate-protein phosphotransferase